jgi:ABC-type glutathione transport system ATPase component
METKQFPRIEPVTGRDAERQVPDPAVALLVEGVSKRFVRKGLLTRRTLQTTHALRDVSLSVGRNEIFGILGANGSGKSTLIRVMSTLLIPDHGKVKVFGYDQPRLGGSLLLQEAVGHGEPALFVAALRPERQHTAPRHCQHPRQHGD